MKTSITVDPIEWKKFGRKVEDTEGKSQMKTKVLGKLIKGYNEGIIVV